MEKNIPHLLNFFVMILFFIHEIKGEFRVVGGFKAPVSFGKFHASLQNLDSIHVCGGAVISRHHILTAAHCVLDINPEYIKVVIGTTDLDKGGKEYDVSTIVTHEKFNFEERTHDIAILKIKSDFDICASRPLTLYDEELRQGNTLILSGFGSQEPNGHTSRQMYALNLTVFDQEICRYAMRYVRGVHDEMFCTFSTVGEGTCHGDSGGPLVNGNQLVGLVSWGIPCAVGFPDVHTRISSYIEWIADQIHKLA